MPAAIVSRQLVPAQGQEAVTIVDDFGTEYQIYVNVAEDATRRMQIINAAVAQQTANETALKDYATQHSIDLTAQLAAGQIKRDTFGRQG